MAYKLIITERAEELLDEIIYHFLYRFKSKQAALHLLENLKKIYERIENNPLQFSKCRDSYLKSKEYREAVTMDMNYLIIFKVDDKSVYILGIFHKTENYRNKL